MRQIHCDVTTKLSTPGAEPENALRNQAPPRSSSTRGVSQQSIKSHSRWTSESLCYYCHGVLTPSYIRRGSVRPSTASTRDHMVPKCRGGSYIPDNIVQSCAGCNEEKGQLTSDEYLIVLLFRKLTFIRKGLSYYCNISRRARYWCSQRRAKRKVLQDENSDPKAN